MELNVFFKKIISNEGFGLKFCCCDDEDSWRSKIPTVNSNYMPLIKMGVLNIFIKFLQF